jgi:hypothetical protein
VIICDESVTKKRPVQSVSQYSTVVLLLTSPSSAARAGSDCRRENIPLLKYCAAREAGLLVRLKY